jgi:hypothetical protein
MFKRQTYLDRCSKEKNRKSSATAITYPRRMFVACEQLVEPWEDNDVRDAVKNSGSKDNIII